MAISDKPEIGLRNEWQIPLIDRNDKTEDIEDNSPDYVLDLVKLREETGESVLFPLRYNNDLVFRNGESCTIKCAPQSSRLRGNVEFPLASSMEVKRYECKMISTEVMEGYCYLVLVDGKPMVDLGKDCTFDCPIRKINDNYCGTKDDETVKNFNFFKNGTDGCFIDNPIQRFQLTARKFGLFTTFWKESDKDIVVKGMPTWIIIVLAAVLLAVVIFIIVMSVIALRKLSAEHPDAENIWAAFQEKRKENLEQQRAKRMDLRQQAQASAHGEDAVDGLSDTEDDGEADGGGGEDDGSSQPQSGGGQSIEMSDMSNAGAVDSSNNNDSNNNDSP